MSVIAKTYFDPSHYGGFGGKAKLKSALKNKADAAKVDKWLKRTDTYNLHRPTRRKFKRRSYIVGGINQLIQIDLAVFSQFAKYNDRYKYILVVIDIFSRKAYGIALKSKSGSEVSQAIDQFLQNADDNYLYCQSDKGTEFLARDTQMVFKKHGVHHYTYTNQEIKASYVERFIRTLKQKIYRYFTHSGGYRYIDVLQELINSYNSSIHRAHNRAPNQINYANQEEVWQTLYNPDEPNSYKPIQFKFKVGDKVRISKYATTFTKGYLPAWTDEIFTISKKNATTPPVYSLKDDHNDELIGTWYEQELQKVEVHDNIYKVEKILAKRKRNGQTQYLVKWLGYGSKFNSYINKSDLMLNYKN